MEIALYVVIVIIISNLRYLLHTGPHFSVLHSVPLIFVCVNHATAVIPGLLSGGQIPDPLTGKTLTLQAIDLMEVYVIIREFPPFVDEGTLRSHFESLADGHEVRSVSISHEKGEAWIIYTHPPGINVEFKVDFFLH